MESLEFLTQNIEELQKQNPEIVAWLGTVKPDLQDLKENLFINKWGLLDLKLVNDSGLFDGFHPQMMYSNWVTQTQTPLTITIVIGSNLGYGINYLLSNTPTSHRIIVVEPRKEMLFLCLNQTDYRPYIQNNRLFFFPPDKNILKQVVSQLEIPAYIGSIYVRTDFASKQIGPEYETWHNIIKELVENCLVNLNTLLKAKDTMVQNELINYAQAIEDGSIRQLVGKATGVKALVLGAGPSLPEILPALKGLDKNALTICALQTLPALQPFDVKPDFCVGLENSDALLNLYQYLDLSWCKDIVLLYSTTMNHKVLEQYPGPTLPIWTFGGIGTTIWKDKEIILDAGGIVGITIIRLLSLFGVSHMVLAGMDFAWKGDKTHAKGHLAHRNQFQFDPQKHVKLEDRDGNRIYSSIGLMAAKRDFEDEIQRSKTQTFNLYGGGAQIKGTQEINVKQVGEKGLLESFPQSMARFKEALDQCRHVKSVSLFEKRNPSWSVTLRSAQKQIDQLFKKPAKKQVQIRNLMSNLMMFIKHDTVCNAYLIKEMLTLAELVHQPEDYRLSHKAQILALIEGIHAKVKEIDRFLG